MDLSSLSKIVALHKDKRTLNAASLDAGFIVFRKPLAVVVPQSADDVLQVIRWANQANCPVAVRGTGHTHAGQTLTNRGIVLDMRSLNRIGEIEGETIQVQGGVLWKAVVDRVLPCGYLPRVLTNNLATTVGGTLATGGLGRSTYHFGVQADNVEAMQVVTGSGELISCSRTENRALFDATRGGLGQFSIITQARVRLREVAPKIRTFCLLYDNLTSLMADSEILMSRDGFKYLRGWYRHRSQAFGVPEDAGPNGAEWCYPLHASVEFDHAEPDRDELLKGLNYTQLVRTEDQSQLDFSNMLEPPPSAARRQAPTAMVFPVTEGLLPWSEVHNYTARLFEHFPPALLPYCSVTLRPVRNDRLESPMLMAPKTGLGMGLGIIPYIPRLIVQQGLSIVEEAGRLLTDHGGIRYLTGWVNFDHDQWRAHYKKLWPQILEWKARFDPRGILNPDFVRYHPSKAIDR